ncbi:MAG TPA: c-type cytochrome [Vicinamibacterales bacterium]|nr:c-type cytochrome [Vicinamibacterales bacterium]
MTWQWTLVAALLAFAPCAASAQVQDHTYSSQDIAAGRKIYTSQCQLCHGPNGEQVNGIDLRRGRFKRSVSDEDIAAVITNGVAGAGMPPFALQASEITSVLAFIRAGFDPSGVAVKVGNVSRGQALYAGKGNCASCHRVNGAGPRVAPDLSDVGASRTPAALQRSLLQPTAAMWPINRPVRLVTSDGREIKGRRLNEDTYTVQVIDDKERLLSFDKATLKSYELATTSPMPSLEHTFTAEEIADLVAYLLSLKGVQ